MKQRNVPLLLRCGDSIEFQVEKKVKGENYVVRKLQLEN